MAKILRCGCGWMGTAELVASGTGCFGCERGDRLVEVASPTSLDHVQVALCRLGLAEGTVSGDTYERGKPTRWWEGRARYRCANEHVSSTLLKSEALGRDACLRCYGSVVLTFPEDVDGPLPERTSWSLSVVDWVRRARVALDVAFGGYRVPKPSCAGVGCIGCCTGPVMVHPDELVDVLSQVTRAQRNAARLVAGRVEDYWCPLLDLGTRRCTVYEARPLICRGHAVTSPPARCMPGSFGKVSRHPDAVPAWREAVKGAGLSTVAYQEACVELAAALAARSDEDLDRRNG